MVATDWIVIVVEDSFDDRQLISKILTHYGVSVHSAKDGNECLELLGSVTPTLIVTDLAMPNRDGWQVLAALRANPATAKLPVVAVTAYHSADVARDAVKAGFDGYFPKPLDPRTFVSSLERVLAA